VAEPRAGKNQESEIPGPRATPDLFGHRDAERALRAAYDSGRLAHAWLITGPRGVGKATLAYRFARWVLAEGAAGGTTGSQAALFDDPGKADPLALDPAHPVFHRVRSGGHADLLVIERTIHPKTRRIRREIVVEDVRRLGEFLSLTPAEGGWRVAIVDVADELNRAGANAVLKLIEEPPPRALILLVSHVPGRLPPTIRSRCRRLALTPLDDADVIAVLGRLAPDLDAAEAVVLARLGRGSPGQALGLAAGGGVDLYKSMMTLVASLPDLDVPALHALGDRLARAGAEAAYVTAMDLLCQWLARAIAAVGREAMPTEIVPGEFDAARRVIGRGDLDQWVALWENISRLAARAERINLNRKQVVLSAFTALESVARA
jgi:DNA polymerase-3 subunit delta'